MCYSRHTCQPTYTISSKLEITDTGLAPVGPQTPAFELGAGAAGAPLVSRVPDCPAGPELLLAVGRHRYRGLTGRLPTATSPAAASRERAVTPASAPAPSVPAPPSRGPVNDFHFLLRNLPATGGRRPLHSHERGSWMGNARSCINDDAVGSD